MGVIVADNVYSGEPITEEHVHILSMFARSAALAIKGNDYFEVSDVEISREGKSYTIDTVEAHPELYGRDSDPHLIIGTDTVKELPTWKEIKRLAELCRIVVVNRPGNTLDNLNQLIPILGQEKMEEIRRIQVEIPPVDISSTEIRRRLRSGLPISRMVPHDVELYIKRHGLYKS
jgi:nicotinate-nucleotide adenylyltransferase